jgi:hypothetical protein
MRDSRYDQMAMTVAAQRQSRRTENVYVLGGVRSC